MALNLDSKRVVVAEVAEVAKDALSAVAAQYRGVTVSEMTELRKKAREQGVYLRVVKNTLARRAFEGTDYEIMSEHLTGPLVLAFSQEAPGAAARVLKDFAKENDKLIPVVAAIEGDLLQGADIERLASMPNREEALAMLMGTMKAPIGKLARTMKEVPGKFVRTMDAVRDSKAA